MQLHYFAADDSGITCRECMFPRANRVHTRPAPAPTPRLRTVPGVARSSWSSPDTSVAAAESISGDAAQQLATRVLAAIVAAGERGITDAELFMLDALAGHTQNSIRPRRTELVAAGLVTNPKDRYRLPIVREVPGSRRPARVWVATDAGRAALREVTTPTLTGMR